MDFSVIVVTFGSLVAAFINAVLVTLAGSIMPSSIISAPFSTKVFINATVSSGDGSRVFFFWKHIAWRIVLPVFIGSSLGVFLGVKVFIIIPESLLSLIIGCLLLVIIWVGTFKLPAGSSKIFILVGTVHSFVATIFGVGAFLQPAILRTELVKMQITGTLAACMLLMDIFKIIGFSSLGFNYLTYLPHIVGATLAGFLGTWLGKRESPKKCLK